MQVAPQYRNMADGLRREPRALEYAETAMRRAGIDNRQINAVREAFRILFREGLPLPAALAILERDFASVPAVAEMVAFVRRSPKGINLMHDRTADEAA